MEMVEMAEADVFTATFSALRSRLQAQIDAPSPADADALCLNALRSDSAADRGSRSDAIREIASPPALLLARLAAHHPQTLSSESLASYRRVPSSVEAMRQSRRRVAARRERLQQRVLAVQTAMDAMRASHLQRLTQNRVSFEQHAAATHANALRRLQALFVECIAEMSKAVERARHASSRQTTSDAQQLFDQALVLERDLQWRWFLARLEEDARHALWTRLLLPDAGEVFARSELSHTLAEIARVVSSNGPVVDLEERVVVDTLVAVGLVEPRNEDAKPAKGKPSLHFVESMAAAWMEVVQQLVLPLRPASGATSSRKPRRASPTLSSSTSVAFAASSSMKSSSLRQIMIPPDNQLSMMAIDSPLSCSGILWLLGADTSRRLLSTSVYVAADDVASDPGRQAIVDPEGRPFVRATVRELVLTRYFQHEFLSLLIHDKELVDERFPVKAQGERSIAELFIATVGNPSAELGAQVHMKVLDSVSIHELCVLFIARGAHTKKPASRTIASLASADALSVLPRSSKGSDDAAAARFCYIRFPRALLRALGSTPDGSWVQNCSAIFIEYHIDVKKDDAGADASSVTVLNKRQKAMGLLGSICSWRSCLDEASHAIAPSGVRVCAWHKQLQTTLDDWNQFTPSLKELKACLKATEELSETESVKKMLLQSSSLLQELTSRQLGQSITTFVDFTKHAVSNAAFEENSGYEFEDNETEDELSMDEETVSSHKAKIQVMKELLAAEQSVTAMMRSAKERCLPMQELQAEMREFDVDIKTDNYELLRELSRRKLAILQRHLGESNVRDRAFGGGQRRMMHSFSDAALTNGRRALLGQEPQQQQHQRGSNARHLLI